jgi:hypothetical protein
MSLKAVTSYLDSRVEALPIPDRGGRGVFAREPIGAGEVIGAWGGEVIDRHTLRQQPPGANAITVQIDEDLFLLSSREGPGDWINHSCEPNVGVRGQIVLVTLRDVRAGEELCYDYAMTDGSDYDELDCACGTPSCRGRVTGDDWRRPELIERYRGYFSPYLARRIDLEYGRRSVPRRRRHRHPGRPGPITR